MRHFSNILKYFSYDTFAKNVAILAFGTILSQSIIILGSIVLAKLYSAEQFGLLTLFSSIVAIFAVPASGRYEQAILLPKENKKAMSVINLMILIGFSFFIIYTIAIFILKQNSFTLLKGFNGVNLFLIPIHIFIIVFFTGLSYWNQRKKNYKKISLINVLQGISNVFLGIVFGIFHIEYGLIYGLILSVVFSVFQLLFLYRKDIHISTIGSIKSVKNKYIAFPKYMMISDVSLTVGQQFLPLVFTNLYNSAIVGYYSMANRFLRMPTIIFTSSISDVFRNEAIDKYKAQQGCRDIYMSTFKKLLSLAIPIFLFIALFSPFLFKTILGAKWSIAGEYARILCILLFFEFISYPFNSLFFIYKKQKQYSILQFLNTVLGFLAIFFSYRIFENPKYSLFCFSLTSACFSCILLYFSFQLSNQKFTINEKK